MLNLTRKHQTGFAAALLCMTSALSFAGEAVSEPAQLYSVDMVVVYEAFPREELAERVMAPAEVKSMIENDVLLELSSRLTAATPSSERLRLL